MNGKSKCKILKDIRRQIAADNDIEYITSECKYQGDCSGTCPKCESELRYLENELAKRQKAGKAVAVAGIAATFMLSTAGCDNLFVAGNMEEPATSEYTEFDGDSQSPSYPSELVDGEIVVPTDPTDSAELLDGEFEAPTDTIEEPLMGDIALPE